MRMSTPIVMLIAALPMPAAAALTARTVISAPSPRPGWFLCDSVDTPFAALVGALGSGRASDITLVAKPGGTATTSRYTVGRADPGAGQIYYSLMRGGKEVGNIHAVNPGMLDPSLPEPLNTSSMTIGSRQLNCRLIDNIRLSALSARRGVTVTREQGKLVYRSYDFAHPGAVVQPDGVQQTNQPSLRIVGGTQSQGAAGTTVFRFVNVGYTYTISLPHGTAAGTLAVVHNGRTILSERLLGFTLVSG